MRCWLSSFAFQGAGAGACRSRRFARTTAPGLAGGGPFSNEPRGTCSLVRCCAVGGKFGGIGLGAAGFALLLGAIGLGEAGFALLLGASGSIHGPLDDGTAIGALVPGPELLGLEPEVHLSLPTTPAMVDGHLSGPKGREGFPSL